MGFAWDIPVTIVMSTGFCIAFPWLFLIQEIQR